ncbi:hypothetical protein [Sphingomonas sp.]|uniref:hypothetical protein n=1 Tax=Sphingomonas sp. TaxID=28214 RepID=UPI003B3A1A60
MSRPFLPVLSVTDAACRLIAASEQIEHRRQQADATVAMLEARWAANRDRQYARERITTPTEAPSSC